MTNKTIEIIVSSDGQSRVETKGFVGAECRDASRLIEQALGQQSNEVLTSDFYVASHERQRLREGQ